MLRIGQHSTRTCQGITRRALLEMGACSAIGLTLPHVLSRPAAATSGNAPVKSLLLIWMWGGPSHFEMWDPKPNAPLKIRGSFRPIATAVPGTQISELLPLSAALADQYTIIRSMAHDQSDHNVGGTISLTGNIAGARASGAIPFPGRVRPSLGSLISYLTRQRAADWPAFTVIGPNCKVSGADLRGQTAGTLGAAHDPFRIPGFSFETGVELPAALAPMNEIGPARLDDRRRLLSEFDGWQKRVEQSGEADRFGDLQHKAFGLLTTSAAKRALNIDLEDDSLRDRYGRTTFGQNLLIARRLIEAGVPCVQVNWSGDAEDEQQGGDGGWDLHYRLFERMQDRYCPIFDWAFTALLDDMQRRGLLASTLVLAMGEFGRTPHISGIGGREHWPFGYSVVVAGGRANPGSVVGATSADGGYPATRPNHPVDLITTVLEKMQLDRLSLLERESGVLGSAIPELS